MLVQGLFKRICGSYQMTEICAEFKFAVARFEIYSICSCLLSLLLLSSFSSLLSSPPSSSLLSSPSFLSVLPSLLSSLFYLLLLSSLFYLLLLSSLFLLYLFSVFFSFLFSSFLLLFFSSLSPSPVCFLRSALFSLLILIFDFSSTIYVVVDY